LFHNQHFFAQETIFQGNALFFLSISLVGMHHAGMRAINQSQRVNTVHQLKVSTENRKELFPLL
jgi:NO-binding membrane sensor protein with MHYT domain